MGIPCSLYVCNQNLLKTMKIRALYFGLLLLLVMTTRASAQTVTYDSIPVDSVITAYPPDYVDSILGAPDQKQSHLGHGDFYAVQFSDVEHHPVNFDKGAVIQVYWSRESSDSCAVAIQFMNYNYSGPPAIDTTIFEIFEGGPENVWHMTTITVPDTGFNALQIGVDLNRNIGQPGADSCFIDAIVLVQSGLASVARPLGAPQATLMNYPNPFYHSSGTRVRINTPLAGMGMLSVTDALGREVAQVPLGEVASGDQETSISVERAGVFFVRLYIDGTPVGAPLEISGE
jgi:hypothetical protein